MTTINTQSNAAQINVVAASAAPKDLSASNSTVSDNSAETSKTTLTLSDEAKSDASDSYDPEKGGVISDYQPLTTLIRLNSEAQSTIIRREDKDYHIDTTLKANSALTSLNKELVKLQDKIEAARPDMLGKKWDFVLKDGKIEVTGSNLNAKDKQWLENTLNRNKTIVGAVKDFYASVVKNYEHTAEHPSPIGQVNGRAAYAYGVADQINGKLQLRSIMDQVMAKTSSLTVNPRPFVGAMELAQGYLKTSSQSTYSLNMADMSDATTAAYVKAHPNQQF